MKLCYHCMTQIKNEKIKECPVCGKSLSAEPVSSKFLRPGTVLQGKFIVGYPLGAGGFGNTYIGWNRVLLRKVAIKEFYPEQYVHRTPDGVRVTVSDPKRQPRYERGLRQFLTEARNVASLQDIKGVVEISNFFEENGTGYIVMEYLEGMDVKTILKKTGNKKDYEWCRRVILTILDTLREIHKRGVLHRDIAPDNIIVTKEGVIKLIDFGAAKNAEALADMTGDIMLKEGYAPIEQYTRNQPQGPYTDLYAVAALLYRMLTGQKPISARKRIEKDSLIPPSDMGIAIPQQAELGMMVCLNIAPEYRLQSADDFMETLDGKYFQPQYEPDWILPPVEEHLGFFGRIAALPVVAKASICFLAICLVLGGGAGTLAWINRTKTSETIAKEEGVLIENQEGKTFAEAKQEVESVISRNSVIMMGDSTYYLDWKIDIQPQYIYNSDDSKNQIVYGSLSCNCSESLFEPLSGEADTVTDDESGLRATRTEDTITIEGNLVYPTYRSDSIRYEELSGLNAYEVAMKLGKTLDDPMFQADKKTEGKNYYEISRIETTDGNISSEDIHSESSGEKEVSIDRIQNIMYYARDFFLWKSVPDFVGKNVEDLGKFATYKLGENEKVEKSGKARLSSGLMADDYYTFNKKYEKGYIVSQTVKKGERLDLHKDMDKLEKGILLHTIHSVISTSGKTAQELKSYFSGPKWKNVTVKVSGQQNKQSIQSVTVEDEKGKKVDCFTPDQKVTIKIKTTVPATPTPRPTNPPSPKPTKGTKKNTNTGKSHSKNNKNKSSTEEGDVTIVFE